MILFLLFFLYLPSTLPLPPPLLTFVFFFRFFCITQQTYCVILYLLIFLPLLRPFPSSDNSFCSVLSPSLTLPLFFLFPLHLFIFHKLTLIEHFISSHLVFHVSFTPTLPILYKNTSASSIHSHSNTTTAFLHF